MLLHKIPNYRNLLIEFHHPYISPINKSMNIPPVLKMYIVNDITFKIIMDMQNVLCFRKIITGDCRRVVAENF